MIRFNNDYNHGAFASILKELGATNSTSYAGYGEDEWCDKAETIIKKLVDNDDALIKFIPGATQANYVVIAAALSSVQSVIAADTGHINCHEAASIENTGHKILELPNTDGKITAQMRRNKADAGGKHPWKAEALEGDVTAATITNWYKEVYEPTYTALPEKTT